MLCRMFGLVKLAVGWLRVAEADGSSTPPTGFGEEELIRPGTALGTATYKLLGNKIYEAKTRTPY